MMFLMIVIAIARIGRVGAVIGGGMIFKWVLDIVFASNDSYHDQCQ